MNKIALALLLFLSLFFFSCNRTDDNAVTLNSSHGLEESHRQGENCQSCHVSGGDAPGAFQAAGTIYQEGGSDLAFQNAVIEFYTEANGGGDLVKTIKGDFVGNFYSTDDINFTEGLYPAIRDGEGQMKYMPKQTFHGACNSCHGLTEIQLQLKN